MDADRRGDERRSPVGDFLLGTLAQRPAGRLQDAELLQIAGDSGLSMSSVLAWVAQAEEAGLVQQRAGPDGRGGVLRLTEDGLDRARNDRRRHRRERWNAPPDDDG